MSRVSHYKVNTYTYSMYYVWKIWKSVKKIKSPLLPVPC